ncbi:hypothetical protein HG531_011435 [Fusarium graminearum]|nr:hypothetical protein HG531_011435 [Fusarium graminearum]
MSWILLVLLSLKLRLEEWKMDPTGLTGSGKAKDVLNELVRLGMMMGSSSEEDSSSSEGPSSRVRLLSRDTFL